jgi:ferredoxin
MMKIIVDHGKCQGHAMCCNYAPDIFELDDYGYNRVPPFQVSAGNADEARLAAAMCPEHAITSYDDGKV